MELINLYEATVKEKAQRKEVTTMTQTQAPPPAAVTREAPSQTDEPLVRSYTETATSTTHLPTRKDKGKQPTTGQNAHKHSPPPAILPPRKSPATVANAKLAQKPKPGPAPRPAPPAKRSNTITLHAVSMKNKSGEMRR